MEPPILSSINIRFIARMFRKNFVFFNNSKNKISRTGFSIHNNFVSTPSHRHCSPLYFLINSFPVSNQHPSNEKKYVLIHSLRKHTFHSSVSVWGQVNGTIPHLGDSITNTTLLEWSTSVGQKVQEGDVIAIIETDKVTVDVISQVNGILIEKLASIGDILQVGDSLYRIETDANGITRGSHSEKDVNQTNNSFSDTNKKLSQLNSDFSSPLRIPSIQFLGKQGWLERHQQATKSSLLSKTINLSQSQPSQLTQKKISNTPTPTESLPKAISAIDSTLFDDFDPKYGRLKISEREIEALMMGGASELPHWEC